MGAPITLFPGRTSTSSLGAGTLLISQTLFFSTTKFTCFITKWIRNPCEIASPCSKGVTHTDRGRCTDSKYPGGECSDGNALMSFWIKDGRLSFREGGLSAQGSYSLTGHLTKCECNVDIFPIWIFFAYLVFSLHKKEICTVEEDMDTLLYFIII